MLLLIDNYDSFVYNLARYFQELGQETLVVRNDRITPAEITELQPAGIVLSPGPCTPDQAGVCVDVVRTFAASIPILGVCLGHQSIAAAYGGRIVRAAEPRHGQTSPIHHDGQGLFAGLPNPFDATRYHSLIVEESSLPPELLVTAKTTEGTIMAVQHRRLPVFGVQFHPESVLTAGGHQLLRNFPAVVDSAANASIKGDLDVQSVDDSEVLKTLPQPLHW